MDNKRVEFVTSILAIGKRKRWSEYGEEYEEHPDKVRKWWRAFKDKYVHRGLLCEGAPMSENQIKRAYDLGLIDSPKIQVEGSFVPEGNMPSAWDFEEGRFLTIKEYCERYGLDFTAVKGSKLVGHNPNHMVYNIEFFKEYKAVESFFEDLAQPLLEDIKKYKPKVDLPKPEVPKYKEHLLVIDIADLHVGKVATLYDTMDKYDIEIAIERAHTAVDYILDIASKIGIEQIVFVGGNDILHVDGKNNATTKGTPQDTDKMWHEAFIAAKSLYIDLITKCLRVAPVRYVHNTDNHGYHSSWMLSQVIEAYFFDHDDMTFDVTMRDRKYVTYHNNLIGITHGDTSKARNLNQLMAYEVPEMWARSRRRYWYTHHIHHKVSKDEIGATVESVRSPSSPDEWHESRGYKGSPVAIEGFVHHRERGQCCRITYNF